MLFIKKTVFKILLVLLLFICILILVWIMYIHNSPRPEIYFSTNFDNGIDMYTHFDATWEPDADALNKGVVTLAIKTYAAPHLIIPLTLEENPPHSFVFHIRVYIASYTSEAINIGTLIYPTGSMSVITNLNEQVGVSNNLFAVPLYSSYQTLKRNKWNDVHTLFDLSNKKIDIYVNNKLLFTTKYEDTFYPLQEIWLGAIWLYGGGRYGAPKNVQYSYIAIGNEGLLPKSTFFEYIRNNLFKIYHIIKKTGR